MFAKLWRGLRSLQLTLIILFLLAGTSVIGTLVPQHRPPQDYQQLFGPAAWRFLRWLQLGDMYHSPWFYGLLGLFALNLLACTLHRVPVVWRLATRPQTVPDETRLRALPQFCALQAGGDRAQVAERLAAVLGRHFARPRLVEQGSSVWLLAQKQRWARLGASTTHLAILVILLGAVIGGACGFRTHVTLMEGDQVERLAVPGQKTPLPLDFAVRCDAFSVELYPGSDRPREFRSLLTLLVDGHEVPGLARVPVRVNHPLRYRGLSFYQSGYGPAEAPHFRLLVRELAAGREFEMQLTGQRQASLPDGGSVAVAGFVRDFEGTGPAAGLELVDASGVASRAMAFSAAASGYRAGEGPYAFQLLDVKQRFYTELQVSKDPGVPLVWLGCLLLVAGLLAAFFASHQRLWVCLSAEGATLRVLVGGHAQRHQAGFAGRFETLCRQFQQTLATSPAEGAGKEPS